ncbi:MliC family protein [Enterobacteriaceae bacterium H11S18]|uniref:MliC family protein n=1 Tax=Dryocola clanedunensis TaxID=2925396 RepID=UPI0022F0E643|nr:MliC family protein [Dryocola clanedunensis]MCT4706459.1 MliC family protein [Dryocola clanedunensis]MCT4713212.1 MliC family protein [Dryocola clanedunensis]
MRKALIILFPALLSGCSYYNNYLEQSQIKTLEYHCDEAPLVVQRNDMRQQVSMTIDNQPLTLKQGLSAEGERFTDGVYVFWVKDEDANVYRHDRIVLHNCKLQPVKETSIFNRNIFSWAKKDG